MKNYAPKEVKVFKKGPGDYFLKDGETREVLDPTGGGGGGTIPSDILRESDIASTISTSPSNARVASEKAVSDALKSKADLVDGKVPASQLPASVDKIIECSSISDFPTTGVSNAIYVAKDTNKTYRWGGTTYVEISASLALGETSSTAYAGDKGKANRDDIDDIINVQLPKKQNKVTYGTADPDDTKGEEGDVYIKYTE